jgi:excisionase family DNA binding protein
VNEQVVISPRVAAVLVRHLDTRQLRVRYRDDTEIHGVLLALLECALTGEMSEPGRELAIDGEAGQSQIVTVLQAARAGKVSARTIIRAIDDGSLPAEKHGHVWAISERSLARWMAARERQERKAG